MNESNTTADDASTDPNDYDIDLDAGTMVARTRDSTNNITYKLHRLNLDGEDVYALTSTVNTPDGASVIIRDIGRLDFEPAEVDLEGVNEAVTDSGCDPLTDEQLQAIQQCYDECVDYSLRESMADVRHDGSAFAIVKDRAYYEDMYYPEGWDTINYYADVTDEQLDVITREISHQMGHHWVQSAVHAEYEADIVIDPLDQDELSKLETTQED